MVLCCHQNRNISVLLGQVFVLAVLGGVRWGEVRDCRGTD